MSRAVWAGTALCVSGVCFAQSEPGPASTPVGYARVVDFSAKVDIWHIRVTDDIKAAETARQMIQAIDHVAQGGADVLVLELGCDKIRDDLAVLIARRIDTMAKPVAVVLRDVRDKRVGVNAMLIGLSADAAWIDPNTSLRDDLAVHHRELAPDGIDVETVANQLVNLAWPKLQERGADPALAQRICVPTQSLSLVFMPDGSVGSIGSEAEPGQTDQELLGSGTQRERVVTSSTATNATQSDFEVVLSPADIISLKWAWSAPKNIRALERTILGKFGASESDGIDRMPTHINRYTTDVQDEFDQKTEQIREGIRLAAIMARDAEIEIDVARGKRGSAVRLSAGVVEKTERSVGHQLDTSQGIVDVCERAFTTMPEIVRTPAPDHALGEHASMAQRETAWRRALTNVKQDIDHARDELAELVRDRK